MNNFNESFLKSVKLHRKNSALIFKNKEISYEELDILSDKIANQLINKEIKKGDIVGVMTSRSIEMIISILAILKVGCAYLPIDFQYPKERIRLMILDSGVKLIISNQHLDIISDLNKEVFIIQNIYSMKETYNVESNQGSINVELNKNDLAYVTYTSGSSGRPKGVMIGHGALINFINGVTEKIKFDTTKRILAVTTISFDIFVLETLLPLTKGVTIVLADESEQQNPKYLTTLIEKHRINMLQMTPSRMKLLLNYDKSGQVFNYIDTIMIGGEILDIKLLNKVKRISKAKIYNMYGPTETTVWSTIADITNTEHINIGKEILNTEVYILDEEGNQVPEGQVGEICIAGDGLALGYLNREDLTNEKFINSSFAFRGRIYKTGDLGKRTDGILYCIGRIDNQVKIRGYRVELEEIESIAAKCRGVERAVAIVKNEDILSLFLKTSSEIDSEDIKKFMSERLPNYMVPSQFIQIDEFPYTSNGKVDRNKLKKMLDENYDEQLIKSNTKGTLNEIEAKIATIIYDLLEIDNLEFDKYISFTSLGITSISYIQIIVAVEAEFEIEFDDEILAYDSSKNISELGKCVELKLC